MEVLDVAEDEAELLYLSLCDQLGDNVLKQHKYHKDSRSFIVYADDREALSKILIKGHFDIEDNQRYKVRRSDTVTHARASTGDAEIPLSDNAATPNGVTPGIEHSMDVTEVNNDELVLMHFEDLASSKLVAKWFPEEKRMTIIYPHLADLEKALLKEQHEVDTGVFVRVRKWQPPEKGIIVEGIPPSVSQRFLELYFKSAKSAGGEIKSLKHQPKLGTAQVFFVDQSIAERVAAKNDHKLNGAAVIVRTTTESSLMDKKLAELPVALMEPIGAKETAIPAESTDTERSLEVLDVGDGELVLMHFEDLVNSPLECKLFPEQRRMSITFKSLADLEKALLKEQHEVDAGVFVRVRKWQPPKKGLTVSGIPSGCSKRLLELYFKNAKQGGGDIESISYDSKRGTAQVFFVQPEIAERVAAKRDHTLKDAIVSVCITTEQSLADTKTDEQPVTVTEAIGLKESTTPAGTIEAGTSIEVFDVEDGELVRLYFEDLVGPALDYKFFPQERRMSIIFRSLADLEKALRQELHVVDEGVLVRVRKWQPPKTGVTVSGIPSGCTKRHLELYFKNANNGGGDIDSIEYNASQGTAQIFFAHREIAERVASKVEHIIKEQPVIVRVLGADAVLRHLPRKGREKEEVATASKSDEVKAGRTVVIRNLPVSMNKTNLEMHLVRKLKVDIEHTQVDLNPSRGTAIVTLPSQQEASKLLGDTILVANGAILEEPEANYSTELLLGHLILSVSNISTETSKEALWCWLKLAVGRFPHTICYANDSITAVTFFKYSGSDVDRSQSFATDYRMDSRTLHIKVLRQTTSIQVHNVPADVSEKHLFLWFDGPKGHGQKGCVKTVDLKDQGRAIVLFSSEDATLRALSYKHVLQDSHLWVALYYEEIGFCGPEQTHDFTNFETAWRSAVSQGGATEIPPQLIVTGFAGKIDEPNLTKFFGNRKMSNGGAIKTFVCVDGEKATITFNDPETADRILQKYQSEGLVLCDCQLVVSVKTSKAMPNAHRDKLLLKNIGDSSEDSIKFFVWGVCDVEVDSVQFARLTDTQQLCAVASFKQPIGFCKAFQQLQAITLDSITIEANQFTRSTSVLVKNLPATAHKDVIEMAFEGEDREVASCTKLSSGMWKVTFPDPKFVDAVLSENITYGDGIKLDVTVYQEFETVKDAREKGKRGRRELRLDFVLPPVIAFVKRQRASDLESVLKHLGCSLTCNDNCDNALLMFVLSPTDSRYKKLLQEWSKLHSKLTDFFGDYQTVSMSVEGSIWSVLETSASFEELKRQDKKNLDVKISNEGADGLFITVTLTGISGIVEKGRCILDAAITEITKKMEREKMSISKTERDLPNWTVDLFKATGFEDQLQAQYKSLTVQLDTSDRTVTFHGLPSDVHGAMKAVTDAVNSFAEDVVIGESPALVDLVCLENIRAFLNGKISSLALATCSVWHAKPPKSVSVHATNQKAARDVAAVFRNELLDKVVTLDSDSVLLLETQNWKDTVYGIVTRHDRDVIIHSVAKDKELQVACKISDSAAILEELHTYLKKNTVKQEFVGASSIEVRYVSVYLKDVLDGMVKKQLHNHVNLSFNENNGKAGYCVSGNADGIINFKRSLNDYRLKQNVITKSHIIVIPGAGKFLANSAKSGILQVIGRDTSTVLSLLREDTVVTGATSGVSAHGDSQLHAMERTLTGGVKLVVVRGDATKLGCDVIVNPANGRLEHIGGLAKAISDAGGPIIAEESDAYVKKNGPLADGAAMATSAGHLPYKMIVHAVGPRWQGGKRNEAAKLFMAVENSLQLADKAGHSSIALPPISSGIFGFPLDKCTKTIVEAVEDYFTDDRPSSLKKVIFVDNNESGVKMFSQAINSESASEENVSGPTSGPYGDAAHSDHGLSRPYGDGARRDAFLPSKRPRVGASTSESSSGISSPTSTESTDVPLSCSGIDVHLIQGSIIDEKADVLVNTVNASLDLTHGIVAQKLLQAAGPKMQSQLTQDYPKGLQAGSMAVSDGHRLQCKFVFHCCCPQYGSKDCETVLKKLILSCLEEADSRKLSCIAIPAIGTGNLRFPPGIVAKLTYDTVQNFRADHARGTLQTVKLIVFDAVTTDAFRKEHTSRSTTHGANSASIDTGASRGAEGKQNFRGQCMPERSAVIRSPGGFNSTSGRDSIAADSRIELGNVTVQVVRGDISDETTSIVVNSTDNVLSLGGMVAQALVKKGGRCITDECRQKGKMDRDGVFLANPGNLSCEHVLHVNSSLQCDTIIAKCLAKAEEMQSKTISFPAIGTGANKQLPSKMASSMLNAIAEFIKSGKCAHLRLIRFVIFEPEMMEDFNKAMQAAFSAKKSFWQRLKGIFNGRSPEYERITDAMDIDEDDFERVSAEPQEHTSKCTVYICGTTDKIARAITCLNEHCNQAMVVETIREPQEVIVSLSTDQFKDWVTLGATKDVKVEVERASEVSIKLSCLDSSLLLSLKQEIEKDLLSRKVEQLQEDVAKRQVQWQYEDCDSGAWCDYAAPLNRKLEEAFKANVPSFKYTSQDGLYIVNFVTMKDISEDENAVAVQRKDLSLGIVTPPEWSAGGTYVEVLLDHQSQEHKKVESAFLSSLGVASLGFLEITRIQNPPLWQQYVAHKKRTQDAMTTGSTQPVERQLWHGAPEAVIGSICRGGFNRSYSGKNAVVYGQGVYFARDATYSSNDTYSVPNAANQKCIIYCLVLTGEFVVGNHQVRLPPAKPGQTSILYECTVDNLVNPGIFVTYQDAQAYPAYVIKFAV